MKFRPMGSKRTLPPSSIRWCAAERGHILVYIVMVMVIFAVLGTAMVSLFSTSISSSSTANESRRAFYLSESGLRYGMSELRANDFSTAVIRNLNDIKYSVKPEGTFELFVFGHFFDSPSEQPDKSAGNSISLKVRKGKIPESFLAQIPTSPPYISIFNIDRSSTLGSKSTAEISGYSYIDATSFNLTIADDFSLSDGNSVCFAVQPYQATNFVPTGGSSASLDLKPAARYIFPKTDGAFNINGSKGTTYFYKRAEDRTDYIRLHNITVTGGVITSIPVAAADYITVDKNNFMVTSVGQSGAVKFGGDMEHSVSLSDHTPNAKDSNYDLGDDNLIYAENETGSFKLNRPGDKTNFIKLNEADKSITLGEGPGPSLGSVWFKDTRSIGGQTNFCQSGGCFFGNGVRVFFTLQYSAPAGEGDGFIFALINGNLAKNDISSAGGDFEQSELLGYSGDSRLPPNGTTFLDNSGPRGLMPPKIGLEFDTKVNYDSSFENSTKNYCSGSSLKADTRNDPGSSGKDAVQYVFWGNDSMNIPCRGNNPSYDDNRHNAEGSIQNWNFNTFWTINSSPALAKDGTGTIYVGSDSTNFYAINPDGTQKWMLDRNGDWFSPTVTSSGRIYAGTGAPENKLYAISSDGAELWTFPTSGPVTTKPAVRSDGTVYFGSDDGAFRAVNSSGTLIWRFDPFTPAPFRSSPALSVSGNTVYFGADNGNFYARHADNGNIVWTASVGTPFRSSPVVGLDGTVYVGNDNRRLYAFNGSTGAVKWSFLAGEGIQSSPALSNDETVVYIGSYDDILYAINTSDGTERWRFTGATNDIQSPITVDTNDTIYFGSNDNRVYALYSDGAEKWRFTTVGDVRTKPAVAPDGTVYVGSYDFKLYAITQFANPKSLKDLSITSAGVAPTVQVGGVATTVDNENNWLKGSPANAKDRWAVRMEVTRALSPTGGTYPYNLRTWVRQCNQADCSDVIGTFYADTRVNYFPTAPPSPVARPPMMEQTINLSPADHGDFERFLFGFTSQTALNETQTATIRNFQVSFIRPGDPTSSSDPNWP